MRGVCGLLKESERVLCRFGQLVCCAAGTPSYVLCYFRHICMVDTCIIRRMRGMNGLMMHGGGLSCGGICISVRTEARRKGWLLWGSLFRSFAAFSGECRRAGILLEAGAACSRFLCAMYMFKPGRYARATRVPDPIGEQEKGAEYHRKERVPRTSICRDRKVLPL